MTEWPHESPLNTFVVRFWREWSAAGPRWHGRIDHVQSGEIARFLDLDGMVRIIQGFDIMPGSPGLPAPDARLDSAPQREAGPAAVDSVRA